MSRVKDTRTVKERIEQHRRDLLAEHARTCNPIFLERAEHIEKSGGERVRLGQEELRDGAYIMAIADLKRHLVAEERADYE
jgi:hypothetical protein